MSFVGITSEDDDEEASSGFLLPVPDFIDVLDASCLPGILETWILSYLLISFQVVLLPLG